jgi:hypothetical protein
MTLGNAAAAHVRLIVWCKECRHQVEPDPAEKAARYGAETPVPDWRERLVCSKCGSRQVRYGGDRDRAARELLTAARPEFPAVLGSRRGYGLPLQVRNRVGSATGERLYVIFPVAWTGAGCEPRRRARMLTLKFPRYLTGSVLSR